MNNSPEIEAIVDCYVRAGDSRAVAESKAIRLIESTAKRHAELAEAYRRKQLALVDPETLPTREPGEEG